MNQQVEVVFGLGSNAGNGHDVIASALHRLMTVGDNFRHSAIYETQAVGSAKGIYNNAVAAACTSMTLLELTDLTKHLESMAGRSHESQAIHLVPLDIDIVVFNSVVVRPVDFNREYFQQGFRQIQPTPEFHQ